MGSKFSIGDIAYLRVNDHVHECTVKALPTRSLRQYAVEFEDENPYIGLVIEHYPEYLLYATRQEANMAIVRQLCINIQEEAKLVSQLLTC